MKNIFTIAAALAVCPFAASFAQDADMKIISSRDSVSLYNLLHQNAPHFMNIPDVPRFALLGKEGKFYLGIGANVKAVALYDAGHPAPDPNKLITSTIPVQTAPGNGGEFRISAQTSNFYFNFVALPGTKNQVGAYFDMDFSGDDYSPKLGHAYLRYRDVIGGYTFSIFSDHAAAPFTIDYQNVNAFTGAKMGMVAWQPRFGKNREWRAGIGLDMPDVSLTNATGTTAVTQRVPDIPFYVQRSWMEGTGWIRFSGIVRNLYYRDLIASKNVDRIGWGVKTSGKSPIIGGLSAHWQMLYGKGVARYVQDLNETGMDLMPDASNPGKLNPVKLWAGYGALQYDWNPRLSSTVTYGHVRTYADGFSDSETDWKTGYKYAQYVSANFFWEVNRITELGAEYIYGRRVDNNGQQAHDNRIQVRLRVSF